MTTYATTLPFTPSPGQRFIELNSPHPDIPSHFIVKGRYFRNYDGKVYCPEAYVGALIRDGCTLPAEVTIDQPDAPTPAVGGFAYAPPSEGAPGVIAVPEHTF